MKRRSWTSPLAVGIVAALLLSACGSSTGSGNVPSATTGAPSASTGSAESPKADRFKGIHLSVAGPAGQIEVIKKWTDQWSAETGATVEIIAVAFADLEPRVLTSTGTGTPFADVLSIGTGLAGQLMSQNSVLEIPTDLQGRLDLTNLAPLYRDYQLNWNGKMYAAPWDCDMLNLYFRKDLLAEPKFQTAFQTEYGRPLAAPTTWAEYADVAKFFTDSPDWDGYGLVELPKRQNHAWNGYLSRAAAYAKSPDDPSFFFDADTMAPRVNNPGFVKALQDWHEAMQSGPPDMLNYGWADNMQFFVSGKAVLDIQWGDIGPISHDENQSVVNGKLGYAMLPGSDQVWNSRTNTWDTPASANRAPFAGFGGWIWVVPKLTKEPAAALDLATYMGQPSILAEASVTPGSGVNPCYTSLLDDQKFWTDHGFAPAEAAEYTAAIRTSVTDPNAVLDLRIPGFPEYKDALELAISEALSGQSTEQAALDKAAKTWDEITDRLGRDSQKAAYRASLGL